MGEMERKFRIIKEVYYSNDYLLEMEKFFVQEWKKNWLGKWKWRYWTQPSYDMEEPRIFSTQHEAEQLIDIYVKMNPYTEVVKEIIY